MFEVLQAYFEQKFTLTSNDISLIHSVFIPKNIKKGEFFLRAGEKANYGAFVTKGFLRSYIIDSKGKEHIIQFAPENWWIADKTALSHDRQSEYFIDAIEDSQVLLIDEKGHHALIEGIPGYADAFHTGIRKKVAAKDKRILLSLSATAEQRYIDFLETYPQIVQRVPQHMLASYLGLSPETLSRVRRVIVKK